MEKSLGEDRVGHSALAPRKAQQGRELGLKIRGKSRVGRCRDPQRPRQSLGQERHPIGSDCQLHSRLIKPLENIAQIARDNLLDRHASAGNRAGQQEGGRLNPVGGHPVGRPAELIDAADRHGRTPQSLDVRAQPIKEPAEVDDFRLAGRMENRGRSAGECGGAHHVGGSGHGRSGGAGQIDLRPAEPCGSGDDVAVADRQVRPQGGQSLKMEIDRPRADPASARQRYDRAAAPGEQGAENAEAGPHAANMGVTGLERRSVARRDLDRVPVAAYVHSQASEHGRKAVDVGKPRDAAEPHRGIGQQGGGHDGKRGVLRTARLDGPLQGPVAGDLQIPPPHLAPSPRKDDSVAPVPA